MADEPAISTSVVGTDAWVVPYGDIDLSNSPDFELALINAATRSQRYVFVELSSVTFIDASAIGAIVRAAQALDSRSRRLKLLGAVGQVQAVLDLTGISEHFGVEARLLDQPQPTEH